jgi:hypothetical protein
MQIQEKNRTNDDLEKPAVTIGWEKILNNIWRNAYGKQRNQQTCYNMIPNQSNVHIFSFPFFARSLKLAHPFHQKNICPGFHN